MMGSEHKKRRAGRRHRRIKGRLITLALTLALAGICWAAFIALKTIEARREA